MGLVAPPPCIAMLKKLVSGRVNTEMAEMSRFSTKWKKLVEHGLTIFFDFLEIFEMNFEILTGIVLTWTVQEIYTNLKNPAISLAESFQPKQLENQIFPRHETGAIRCSSIWSNFCHMNNKNWLDFEISRVYFGPFWALFPQKGQNGIFPENWGSSHF